MKRTAMVLVLSATLGACGASAPSATPPPATATPEATASPTASSTPQPTETATASPAPTASPSPSESPTVSPTASPTASGSEPASESPGPSDGSALPSASGTASGTAEIKSLLADDFSSAAPEWSLGTGPDYDIGIADGVLRFGVTDKSAFTTRTIPGLPETAALHYEIDATPVPVAGKPSDVGGIFGVLCAVDKDNYYLLGARLRGGYLIYALVGGKFHEVASGDAPAGLINAAAVNHVSADCVGDAAGPTVLSLSINGQHLVSAEDASFRTFNGIGLYVETTNSKKPVTIDYDNVALTSGSVTPVPPAFDAEELALLRHIPAEFRFSCAPPEDTTPGSFSSRVECSPPAGADSVTYTQYPDAASMNQQYQTAVQVLEATKDKGSCSGGNWPSEASYTSDGKVAGRVVCGVDFLENVTIQWTDTRINVLTTAVRNDTDKKKLHDFWVSAGPNP